MLQRIPLKTNCHTPKLANRRPALLSMDSHAPDLPAISNPPRLLTDAYHTGNWRSEKGPSPASNCFEDPLINRPCHHVYVVNLQRKSTESPEQCPDTSHNLATPI